MTAAVELWATAASQADVPELARGLVRAFTKAAALSVLDRARKIAELELVLRGGFGSPGEPVRIGVEWHEDGGRVELVIGPNPQRVPIASGLARAAAETAVRHPIPDSHAFELAEVIAFASEKSEQLERVNRELEDTNRGVVALYAELDDQAEVLRRISESKSHFLSNASHELRTPLNSVLGLSRLLLDRTDGELTREQEKQVRFIRNAAESLRELVDDLLDLAKVEAGRIDVRPTEFSVEGLFGGLRGMLRPLVQREGVDLTFEAAEGLPIAQTDEGKVSQVLRNLISNALKYTDQGEVRVSAWRGADDRLVFAVRDTGIGIAPEDQLIIFDEFVQIENPLQKRVKGTGLGLPLSRKLAHLLGGTLEVYSEVGKGSCFTLTLPRVYQAPSAQRP